MNLCMSPLLRFHGPGLKILYIQKYKPSQYEILYTQNSESSQYEIIYTQNSESSQYEIIYTQNSEVSQYEIIYTQKSESSQYEIIYTQKSESVDFMNFMSCWVGFIFLPNDVITSRRFSNSGVSVLSSWSLRPKSRAA